METKKQLYTLLKITVTCILLYWVFTNISFTDIYSVLQKINIEFFIVALLCFSFSQIISAKRLYSIFISSGFAISRKSNYKLYLLGMFYNFFIPGGVGGDAYKVYILNKTFNWPIKKLSAVVFIDRFFGLIAISFLTVLICFFVPYFKTENLFWLLGVLLILGALGSFFILKQWFNSFLKISTKAILLSFFIQLLQCLSVVFILLSLKLPLSTYLVYILVFLISSVLSIFSFSGIGVREMIFLQASSMFLFDASKAVTVGLLFSVLTAVISLFGIVYHFKSQKKAFIKQRLY
ncbi:flippase-like domain-containing protein [Tamlana sp. 62-3]|uniref:Flippase-like domain-containing protein n=1 Tax=Neotamlana sargassicola TaxID=2883125 RepID=A0A9X1I418_9FLAO|nr:lysylphosphatidylglycerol synthase transmembrane domain-containing protein [Tamlana sargassicola]MCB4807491.1 flippase-like domain-containing protein [Tamlana sargassicola]